MRLGRLSIALILGLAAPASAVGQADSAVRRVDRIQSKADPKQSYALLLPAGYSPGRRWPLLILMDPRGRARIPLDCFAPAATRLGYVVMSSYNTRSDETVDPNPAAVNAMLADAGGTLAIDDARIYLAGFSGTARAAWMMAAELVGHVAGIAGFGAGLPPTGPRLPSLLRTADWDARFSVAGGAGRLDFNHLELVALDDSLRAARIAHWIRSYPGEHAWPPPGVCEDALWWLHARAMKTGLAPRDTALAAEDRARRRSDADSLIAAGDPSGAAASLRTLIEVYDGWLDVRDDRARLDRLEHLPELRNGAKAAAKALAAERDWLGRAARSLRAAGATDAGFDPVAVFRELDGPALLRAAGDSADRVAAESARRRLEWLFVTAAFYQPRSYLAQGKAPLAASFLTLAEAIHPLRGEPCRFALEAALARRDSAAAGRYRSCGEPPGAPPR